MTSTERGNDKLCYEGHMFVFDKFSANGKVKFWRCQFRGSCKARLHTSAATRAVVNILGTHSDPSDAAAVEVAVVKNKLKIRAAETQETPSQLINHVLAGTNASERMVFPSNDVLAKTVSRVRKSCGMTSSAFKDRSSIVIPEEYATYKPDDGPTESFSIGDSGSGDVNRILIFGRESISKWIAQVDKVYVDGTFSLAPKLFYQLFVILGERSGFVFPLCYALLPNKAQETYSRMITLLLGAWPELNPLKISLDFEIALMSAFQCAFPQAEIQGCFFHLAKSMKRKVAKLGLLKRYKEDPDFALAARMIPAVAFVPLPAIETAMAELAPVLPPELMPLLYHFEDYYLGRLRYVRGNDVARAPARFSMDMWTVYQRTLNGESRTNNFAEAAHRKLQSQFGVDHPTLFRLIDGLKKNQSSQDVAYNRFVGGQEPTKRRSKYVQADENILRIVNDYKKRTMLEYLQELACNFRFEDAPSSRARDDENDD